MDLDISLVDEHHFLGAFPSRDGMIQILMYLKNVNSFFFITIYNYYHSFVSELFTKMRTIVRTM